MGTSSLLTLDDKVKPCIRSICTARSSHAAPATGACQGAAQQLISRGQRFCEEKWGGEETWPGSCVPLPAPSTLTHTYRTQEGQRAGSAPGRCPRRFEIESAENKHPRAPPQGFSPPVPAQGPPLSRTQHRRLLKQQQMASQRIDKPTSCLRVQYKKQQGDCQVFTR